MKTTAFTLLAFLSMTGIAVAAGDDDGGKMIEFAWRIFNFAIFVGVIYFLARKAIKEYFLGRRDEIQSTIEEAERLRDEAREKLQEYNVRLEKASQEIEGIAEMIRSQGDSEKEAILKDAESAVQKMKIDAEARIDHEFKKATEELKGEAARLSLEIAEEILSKNISEKDHEAMVDDFLNRMVTRN